MTFEYFMHCVFEANKEDIEKVISFYCKYKQYQFRLSERIGFKVYDILGWKFTWLYDPPEFIIDEEDIESEIILLPRNETQKALTEVRICFTEGFPLNIFFAPLVDELWQTFPRNSCDFKIESLADKPTYYSCAGYHKAEALQKRASHDSFLKAFPPEKKRGKGGKSKVAIEKQLEVIRKWDYEIHVGNNNVTLDEFLEQEFGSINGLPNVPNETFYSWRTRLIKKGLYKPPS